MKTQQENLVKTVVSYCKPWKNIMYHAINEPAYHHWRENECLAWHKMVVGWIDSVIGSSYYKPQFGVNVFGYGSYTYQGALIDLVNGINNEPYAIKVSAVSYHACEEWWMDTSEDKCGNDIGDLITWHRNTNAVKDFVCIIDTDGTPRCRKHNDLVSDWAQTVHFWGEDFNHKDLLWRYYDAITGEWVNQFEVDDAAMMVIYEAFN